MSQTTTSTKYNNETIIDSGSDNELVGSVLLDSGDMEGLSVGIYEKTIPQPSFHIEVYPQDVAITSTLVRIDEGGEYKLTYHFQNFQDKPCKVTVYKC